MLNDVVKYVGEIGISIYLYDYKTIIFAGRDVICDDKFVLVMRTLHENIKYSTSEYSEIMFAGNFVVVLNQKEKLKIAINVLHKNKDKNTSFEIYEKDDNLNEFIFSEASKIDAIKYALKNNTVCPFYQGIKDNATGKITTYEALMRIIDENGDVQTPYMFMDTAKKCKVFNKMTNMMIEKVLNDFATRSDKISINICVSDLDIQEFKEWFISAIEKFPEPKRIFVELLESDDCEYEDSIIHFTRKLQSMGVSIAIDDFGAGYSTLARVMYAKPQIIKIDGSIVKNICKDENCLMLVKAITNFAKSLNAVVVAEFVESEEIQEKVLENGIEYSQGYLFAKPVSSEEVRLIDIEQNENEENEVQEFLLKHNGTKENEF